MAEACFKGPLHAGKTGLVMSECPTAAGSKTVTFTTDADTILVSLYAESVSGTLDVEVFTVGKDGQELSVISFPQLSAATSEILLKKAATTLDNIKVVATYSDAAKFDIRAKGLGVGELNARLLGASDGRTSQTDIPDTGATLIVPAAFTDRAGMVLKNFNAIGGATLYIGFTAAEATVAAGYPIVAGESLGIDMAAGVAIYGISSSGDTDVRILEASS